ncbi:MAG TPA: hypothetical protein VFW96_12280 [Thermomicrobiales bacterium]|nr:hypothetical protein [Thermomicrobiales bacterium]
MATHRVRAAIDHLRRWNARFAVWGRVHPWGIAALVALGFVLVGGLLNATWRWLSLRDILQQAAITFLIYGVCGSVRGRGQRKASAGERSR